MVGVEVLSRFHACTNQKLCTHLVIVFVRSRRTLVIVMQAIQHWEGDNLPSVFP